MEYDLSKAVNYHYDQFPPKNLEYGQYINELLGATGAIAGFDQMLKNLHNNEILLAPLRNQEAVISSRIEGTISTMDEILEYEAQYEEMKSPSARSDIFETLLYQRTLKNAQAGLESGNKLSPAVIRSMHQQLLSFGRGAKKLPGQFKYEQNYLADKSKKQVNFIPISPEKLDEGIDRLFDYLRSSQDPTLIKAALMHLEFEASHPFQDGNGRIGRMLITRFLWEQGIISQPHFYISGFFEEHKDEYIDKMRQVSETGNWSPWIGFFLNAVEQQAIKNLNVAESINKLYQEMKLTLHDLLSSKWSLNALDFVFTNPVFRGNRFASSAGIPVQTSFPIIRKLVEAELLQVKAESSGRRPALYSFEPLMRMVRV